MTKRNSEVGIEILNAVFRSTTGRRDRCYRVVLPNRTALRSLKKATSFPPLLEIHQVADRLNVIAVGNSEILLQFLQHRRLKIISAELLHELIPRSPGSPSLSRRPFSSNTIPELPRRSRLRAHVCADRHNSRAENSDKRHPRFAESPYSCDIPHRVRPLANNRILSSIRGKYIIPPAPRLGTFRIRAHGRK